jgi:hypothetical protein
MLEQVPYYISTIFGLISLLTLGGLWWAFRKSDAAQVRSKSGVVALISLVWLLVQAVLSLNQVYIARPDALPPDLLLLGILPIFVIMVLTFGTRAGRALIDQLSAEALTYLHVVRIPVELVLYALFLHKTIPELMTFSGRNFDILAGITAPFIAYFGWKKAQLSRLMLLWWNIAGIALLTNIVVSGLLSAPTPLQQLAFEQPNIAVLHFPFIWLPTFVVPVVLFAHLVVIRRLLSAQPAQPSRSKLR